MNGAILVTESIALEATAVLMDNRRGELIKRFPSFFDGIGYPLEEAAADAFSLKDVRTGAAKECGAIVTEAGEGGFLSALWRLGDALQSGMDVDMRALPVRQETIEICEFYGLNPYYALSGGQLLIAAEEPWKVKRKLEDLDTEVTEIGYLTDEKARILRYPDHIRYLDRPQQEELRKLYPDPLKLPRIE